MDKILCAGFMMMAAPVWAETQYDCTMYKICQPHIGCDEAELEISATASDSELRIGPEEDVLILAWVMGMLGKGITYAGTESPGSYNVITLRPNGEMYMSSHKSGKYGGLGTMNLRCKVK